MTSEAPSRKNDQKLAETKVRFSSKKTEVAQACSKASLLRAVKHSFNLNLCFRLSVRF